MTGHLAGCRWAIEAIACVKEAEEDFVPPTINTGQDEACENVTPNVGVSTKK